MAELMKVVCIGTVILMLSGGVVGYYHRGVEEEVEQIEAVPPDIETSSYLFPKVGDKYIPYAPQPPNGLWKHVSDPNLYVLTERESEDGSELKAKRNRRNGIGGFSGSGPSLSIVNPLEVLRQRLLLEIARRKMRQSEDQVQANRELLKNIGKRSLNGQRHAQETDTGTGHGVGRLESESPTNSRDTDRWSRHQGMDTPNA